MTWAHRLPNRAARPADRRPDRSPRVVGYRLALDDEGLPVGLQIIGRHPADRTVLAAAAAFEASRPWTARRPQLYR